MSNAPVKLTILFIHLLGCIFLATGSTIAGPLPAEITINQLTDLYTPVVFDHLAHSESYECHRCHHDSESDEQKGACSTCHAGRRIEGKQQCSTCHSANNDEQKKDSEQKATYQYHIDTPALKGTWHLLCRNCHVEDDGPTGCQDCHAFTPKGQQFFKLTK